ncbi:hypothetical protein KEM60_00250 [Austwickia sp. TVS 96-490-7B]|nr:hypothetical protein [Austwickia sp. TVS 96-490-7B]
MAYDRHTPVHFRSVLPSAWWGLSLTAPTRSSGSSQGVSENGVQCRPGGRIALMLTFLPPILDSHLYLPPGPVFGHTS